MRHIILTTHASTEYELLDSGGEEKLERYGSVVLARPDPSALWEKHLSDTVWKAADAWYERKTKGGEWHTKSTLPKEWAIDFGGLHFIIKPTSFKHTGLFPEQLSNWEWTAQLIQNAGRPVSVLNLFAYTGGASLAAAQAGASVTHVDASKTAVAWARENAKLSGLAEKPIRWITDDVLVYIEREMKRGVHYDGIIMDPPAFGHGPKDELWKIEEDFLTLMKLCRELLTEKPLFFIVNGYASGYSSLAFAHNLATLAERFTGREVEHGELTIAESGSGRLLPCGIFARVQ